MKWSNTFYAVIPTKPVFALSCSRFLCLVEHILRKDSRRSKILLFPKVYSSLQLARNALKSRYMTGIFAEAKHNYLMIVSYLSENKILFFDWKSVL